MYQSDASSDSPTGPCGARARNAAATRQAILEAARRCFAHEGYEQVGVRDIAALAGIDPALVNRYFGSKEGLFAEAVRSKFDLSAYLDGDRSTLGERLVRMMLTKKPAADGHDPLLALLRSSSSDTAGAMMRDAMVEGFVFPLAARLEGPDAHERAELIGSTLLGLVLYRNVLCSRAGEIEQQVALAAPMLQALIDGPTGSAAPAMEGNRVD